jgi:hypothetical protein
MGKQGLEMDKKLDTGEEPTKRRIDLSVAQVAGSAVAAVVAAVLASKLGVYGTVIGAGVVSVVATSGGTIFQHFFKRTGEQLREVTVHARPRGNQPYADNETRVLRTVEVPTDLAAGQVPGEGGFTEATVHGTRKRGLRRSLVGAAVVFAVAMGGITTYELVSQSDLSGDTGTSIGNFVRGGGGEKKDPPAEQPPATPGGGTSGTGEKSGPGTGKQTPDPGASTGSGGKGTPDPGATTTPDPGRTDGGSTGTGQTGGGSGQPTPPAKETPAGNGGTEDADGAADGKSAAGLQQAPPASPRSGATTAP